MARVEGGATRAGFRPLGIATGNSCQDAKGIDEFGRLVPEGSGVTCSPNNALFPCRYFAARATTFKRVKASLERVGTPKKARSYSKSRRTGHGQLTLVEHALCPLDLEASLSENLIHTTQYHYTDRNRHQQTSHVRVFCPLGLSPHDELFLWGLLSLTLSQPEPESELHATPHYFMRQLGLIDQHARRGGRQYQQFAESLARLSAVVYQNDGFYDPIRAEHRSISFGFLSYSLPLEPGSCRAWRLAWNPLFFELVQATAGHFRFDLATYRSLDPASRRLFLLLTKVFQRRPLSPRFDLHELAVHALGFSPTIAAADLKKKVRRCVERLKEHGIVSESSSTEIFQKEQAGRYRVLLKRGPYYDRATRPALLSVADSALWESLSAIGLDGSTIVNLQRQHPVRLLREWVDITLAARERFGERFFKRSAAAYFMNNVQQAAVAGRRPPDWWHDLRKAERLAEAEEHRRREKSLIPSAEEILSSEAQEVFGRVVEELFAQFQAAGQSVEAAKVNARRFALEHVRRSQSTTKQNAGTLTALRACLPQKPSF